MKRRGQLARDWESMCSRWMQCNWWTELSLSLSLSFSEWS